MITHARLMAACRKDDRYARLERLQRRLESSESEAAWLLSALDMIDAEIQDRREDIEAEIRQDDAEHEADLRALHREAMALCCG